MSTKTTLKRVALVAVSALGFGVMSVVPANAVYTSAITLSTTSLTVVNGGTESSSEAGFFYIDTTELDGSTATADGLQSSGESLYITTTAWPTGGSSADLNFSPVTIGDTVAANFAAVSDGVADTTSLQIPQGSAAVTDFESNNNSWSATAALNNEANRYWVAVYANSGATDKGEYTVRVRLTNGDGAIVDKTIKVKFVTSIADGGATITLAKAGNITTGDAYAYADGNYMTATLKDANGGRLVNGIATTGAARGSWAPTLSADIMTAAGAVDETLSAAPADSGVTAVDHLCTATTCDDTVSGGITGTLSAALLAVGNGVYGLTDSGISATASTAKSVRVRATGTSASASISVIIVANTAATADATAVTATATGLISTQNGVSRTVASKALSWDIPTSTETISLAVDTDGAAGDIFNVTTSWSGTYATAAVSPADATVTNVTAGTDGKFTLTLTNTSSLSGGVATVEIKGFATISDTVTLTVNWGDAVPTTISMSAPVSGAYVKTGSTTTWTATVLDQFGNAMAGVKVQPAVTGENNPDSDTYASLTSDSNGQVTYSITDTLAAADDTDAVSFTAIGYASATASRTVTYKATLPTVANMATYYSQTIANASASTITTAVPSAGIMDGASGVTLVIARNLSKSLAENSDTDINDMVAIRVRSTTAAGAASAGAVVTLTAGTGGHVLNGAGLPATSASTSADSDGDSFFRILATGTGAITFTASSGSTSATIKLIVADQSNAAGRTVAISGEGSGTSNGDGVPVTATVKDRYGNGVANVNLIVTASGVGSIAGGSTSQSFTTDANGTYTFLATSSVEAGGSATYSVRASNATDSSSIAGYVGATPVDSTLAAGVASATHTVTFAAGANKAAVAAEAASDAALEAIDAANAATDAANLAAEAADAATVAAEEARDAADAATAAVEALASEVATMLSSLKAQLTTLAKTVAKIAKKVKA